MNIDGQTTGKQPSNDTGPTQGTEPRAAMAHRGSCHCGAVRFEVDLEAGAGGTRCNCTICTKTAQVGAITKPEAFRLLSGEASLGSYEWASKMSRRYFCTRCGIHVFGRGHLDVLGGDFVSINLNALDDIDVGQLAITFWDGRHDNWRAGTRPTPWPVVASPSS